MSFTKCFLYQLHPVRPYPELLDQLEKQLFCVDHHDAYLWADPETQKYVYGEIKPASLPFYKNGKLINLLQGPFESKKTIKDPRPSFSLWQHPVDHLYELYRYFRFEHSRRHEDPQDARTWQQFGDMSSCTLEQFVDSVIENQGQIVYKGNKCILETTKISAMNYHDLVGTIENIDLFLNDLQDFLQIKLTKTPKMFFEPIKENYRRSDLELLFKKDIETFERCL